MADENPKQSKISRDAAEKILAGISGMPGAIRTEDVVKRILDNGAATPEAKDATAKLTAKILEEDARRRGKNGPAL